MRGSQLKKIKKWCEASWNETTPEEKEKFGTFDYYLKCMKEECKRNPQAKKFVQWSLDEHFSGKK